jgi:predicted metalloprotease with PDZ domain
MKDQRGCRLDGGVCLCLLLPKNPYKRVERGDRMPIVMRRICSRLFVGIFFALGVSCVARAQDPSSQPIKILVDATRASSQKILHADLEIPASPGPLTLFYCKWMPADHSPDGPIANLTGLKFSANGKKISWRRDLDDMYAIHLEVPPGSASISAHLDFLLSAPGPTIDFADSSSSKLMIVMWHEVLLYPKGRPANQIMFDPTLRLPDGWKFNTSLPVASQSGNTVTFAPVPLDLLVDSPVQSGEFMRVIPLNPGEKPLHEVDVAADERWALDLAATLIESYKRLVAEASALYQSHHYRDYHFLLTLSDNVLPLGQEHHESSDDRVPEHTLADPNGRLLAADLFPHEFTHSWNGQFRRPVGLATPDFQQPMRGELLWVYEGLTDYLGTVLAARSGLRTPEQTREEIASIASMLDHRAGRSWRSLQDTADSAQVLYFSPAEWASYRRGTDFYRESVLLWLEVDVTLRKLTQDKRSMNDFCRIFYGGPDGAPVIKTYTFEDIVSTLSGLAPYDWRTFLRERLDSNDHAPLGGIAGGGWELVYTDTPNEILSAQQSVSGGSNFTSSLGLVVKSDGTIQDVIPGMPAELAGLSPYMKIIGIGDRQFSMEEMNRVVENSKSGPGALAIVVSNTGTTERHEISYRGGLRGPHLKRSEGAPDYLEEILRPLAK